MRISDWSSDVCSSDLQVVLGAILLDARSAWVLAAAAAAGFVLLVVAHRTLVLPETLRIGLFDLYILGALVSFVLVGVLLVVFVTRINANLRPRDPRLAPPPPTAGAEDPSLPLGLPPSGAAHDPGTPPHPDT